MQKEELIELFRKTFPFWDNMSAGDKETFIRSSYEVKFEAGTNIHDGNECTGVILIKSGSLRLYLLSEEGKEITLYRLFPGDMCILSASCVRTSQEGCLRQKYSPSNLLRKAFRKLCG